MSAENINDWPLIDTELVEECPMCGSLKNELYYSEVKDWAFKCAPGSWRFHSCLTCNSLFLNPRPTKKSISKAYGKYYTHESTNIKNSFKLRLYNEFMYHKFGIVALNRLNLMVKWWLPILNPFIYRKFPIDELLHFPRGSLLDIGCGNGDFLINAKQMGYTVYGLELDDMACSYANGRGLKVWQGSYEILDNINLKFDYIVCSHVIEHVHEPVDFLNMVLKVSKPSTILFLAWPNPNSIVLKWFKKHWRGLEAPRHLCLPSVDSIASILSKLGFKEIRLSSTPIHTFGESLSIKLGSHTKLVSILNNVIYVLTRIFPLKTKQDIVEMVCSKNDNN